MGYNPVLGVFAQRDPIEEDPNLQQYVGGNPVNWIDPSGLKELDADDLGQALGLGLVIGMGFAAQVAGPPPAKLPTATQPGGPSGQTVGVATQPTTETQLRYKKLAREDFKG